MLEAPGDGRGSRRPAGGLHLGTEERFSGAASLPTVAAINEAAWDE